MNILIHINIIFINIMFSIFIHFFVFSGVSGPSQKRYIKYFEQLRNISRQQHTLLRNSFNILASTSKAEIVCLTLNNIIPVKSLKGDQKSRDERNATWTLPNNWSLLITHYSPVPISVGERNMSHINVNEMNDYNLTRMNETQEFFFKARATDEEVNN